MSNIPLVLITTRVRATVVVVMTGALMYSHTRALVSRENPFTWVGRGALPSWLSIPLTAGLYAFALLMSVWLVVLPLRKDEKAVAAGLMWSLAIVPIAALFPTAAQAVKYAQVMCNLIALLAAVAIWASFRLRSA